MKMFMLVVGTRRVRDRGVVIYSGIKDREMERDKRVVRVKE